MVEYGETCEPSDGDAACTDTCTLLPTCNADGDCVAVCGDGAVNGLENCDDGNRRDGDGCDGQCNAEAGYACVSELRVVAVNAGIPDQTDTGSNEPVPESVYVKMSFCTPICGDGVQQRGESCDPAAPGNERGSTCSDFCSLAYNFCGNGLVDGNETCDDATNLGLDGGCAPGCSPFQYCGNGVVETVRGEECDMGKYYNQGAYGTCTSTCQVAARCGDGVVQACGNEECDDANGAGGDGCAANCKWEITPLR